MPDYICVEPDPIAEFSFLPGVFGNPTESIYFQNGTVGASTYSWDFGDGSNSNLSDPTHIFSNTFGGYSVTLYAYSNSGCVDSVTNPIAYEEGLIYYIPNTFTPDQDEFNQTWKPIFTSGFDPYFYELSIYNRWGEIIWVSNNVNVGWDGSYGESYHCQEGIYTWKINFKIKGLDDRRLITGTLNLLK
jgi:gliding motility-associated-like protein